MKHIIDTRKTWKQLLKESGKPLLLPVEHGVLTAWLIELGRDREKIRR